MGTFGLRHAFKVSVEPSNQGNPLKQQVGLKGELLAVTVVFQLALGIVPAGFGDDLLDLPQAGLAPLKQPFEPGI